MKQFFPFLMAITLIIGFYTVFSATKINAEANDSIQASEPFSFINKKYGSDKNENELLDLRSFKMKEKEAFSENNDFLLSKKEKNLLARLVHAEAKGEPYVGKVAVATVVLNRVEHKEFPDTVKEVIYEKNAFEPVSNGSINEPADKESVKAVQDAIQNKGNNDELLYFYNPDTATSDWILTRKVVKTIGNHSFAI